MSYAVTGGAASPELQRFADDLGDALERAGFAPAGEANDADLVLNLIDSESPRPFRRRSRGTFVAALHERPSVPADFLEAEYPLLVRALANVVLCHVPRQGVWFTTMERGHYRVQGVETGLADAAAERLAPLACSRLVIDNELRTDLLPAPFPIEELLDEHDLRHVKRLYGIGGLSYGNLSARRDETRFWMSASGVDKTQLAIPGRDILLVSGYDAERSRMILSVPPNVEPRRVSVDAIEHWMIYRAQPGVGAILHVHAWVEGIAATEVNFPCGTEELAVSVAELLAAEPDPDHAVIGLHNHGITATGESLAEILDRIEPRVVRQVPMT